MGMIRARRLPAVTLGDAFVELVAARRFLDHVVPTAVGAEAKRG